MKIFALIIFTVFTLIGLSCSNQREDREQIISLVFNSQIGNYEHFGQTPPVPPLAPDFEDVHKFKSIEVAKNHLKGSEWGNYFEEYENYDSRVAEWKSRMKSLKRRIIFFNKSKINQNYSEWAEKYVSEYGFKNDFLKTPTKWDKSNIQNESEYEIVNYTHYPDQKLDSIYVGIMQFSEIGFNNDKNEAILYFDWLCGGHCGHGNLAIMKKENNTWRIEEILNLWIS